MITKNDMGNFNTHDNLRPNLHTLQFFFQTESNLHELFEIFKISDVTLVRILDCKS